MKRLLWLAIMVSATLTLAAIAWQFRGAAWLFVLSLVVAAALRPLIDRFVRRGLSLKWALLLTYGVSVGAIGGLLLAISLPLANEVQLLANDLAIGYQHILVIWPEGNQFQQTIARQLLSLDEILVVLLGQPGLTAVQTLSLLSATFLGGMTGLLTVIILSIYWTADRVRFERLWLSLLPIEQRAPAREIWRDIEISVGAYVRSEFVQSLLAGLFLGFGYWLMGLRYPIILALIGALAWFIPLLGGFIALIPVILVGSTSNLVVAVLAAVYTLIIFAGLEWVIEPRLFKHQRFSSLLMVLAMLALVDAFGLVGLIVAAPLAVAIEILFKYSLQQIPVPVDKPVPPVGDLQERLAEVRARLTQPEANYSPEVASLSERLARLLEEVDHFSPIREQQT
jgi:predicted PurR-regulated permease PerM